MHVRDNQLNIPSLNRIFKYKEIRFEFYLFVQFRAMTMEIYRNHTTNSINVFTRHYEPNMYRDENGQFERGIEFDLMEIIGQKFGKSVVYSTVETEAFLSSEESFVG